MPYTPASAELRQILAGGMPASPSSGAALSRGGNGIYSYCSSHAAEQIVGAGFFAKCGAQPFSSTGTPTYDGMARSSNNVGVRPGDLLVNIESSAGATPGRVTWHCAKASTLAAGGGAYDCTVSAHAST